MKITAPNETQIAFTGYVPSPGRLKAKNHRQRSKCTSTLLGRVLQSNSLSLFCSCNHDQLCLQSTPTAQSNHGPPLQEPPNETMKPVGTPLVGAKDYPSQAKVRSQTPVDARQKKKRGGPVSQNCPKTRGPVLVHLRTTNKTTHMNHVSWTPGYRKQTSPGHPEG